MAKSIIDEIKLAEEKAQDIIAKAHTDAAKIIDEANVQAKNKLSYSKTESDTKAASMVATAENNAFKVKAKAFDENNDLAEELKGQGAKNLDKAVNLIIKEIIPE